MKSCSECESKKWFLENDRDTKKTIRIICCNCGNDEFIEGDA